MYVSNSKQTPKVKQTSLLKATTLDKCLYRQIKTKQNTTNSNNNNSSNKQMNRTNSWKCLVSVI